MRCRRVVPIAVLAAAAAIAVPRRAAGQFSISIERPGFSFFAGPPPVVYAPPPVVYAPPPVVYGPPVVVAPRYYAPVYRRPRWKHWKHHRRWHGDDWDDD